MQVDGDNGGNFESEQNAAPDGSNQLPSGSLHAPSPLYTTYYTKSGTIPTEQLSLYQGSEFGDEIPEDPPPFEHCYAPGETPKQFEPKTNHGN